MAFDADQVEKLILLALKHKLSELKVGEITIKPGLKETFIPSDGPEEPIKVEGKTLTEEQLLFYSSEE